MKYKLLILIVLVLLAFATFLYLNQKSSDSIEKNESMPREESSEISENNKIAEDKMTSENYIVYNKQAFDAASAKKRVLFFYANWCPICKPADSDFKANVSKFPDNVVLFRVNYNDSDTDQIEKALAQKYGITYQHTFVQVDKDGKEITKWNGGQTDKLLSSIK